MNSSTNQINRYWLDSGVVRAQLLREFAERTRRQLSMGPRRDGLESYLSLGVGLPRFRMNSSTNPINKILVGFRCGESSIT